LLSPGDAGGGAAELAHDVASASPKQTSERRNVKAIPVITHLP
jgi:hypothetical protein